MSDDSVDRLYSRKKEEYCQSHKCEFPVEPAHEVCWNCWNLLNRSYIDKIIQEIQENIEKNFTATENGEKKSHYQLSIDFSFFLDVPRILCRGILSNSVEKTVNFPTFETLYQKIVSQRLKQRYQTNISMESNKIVSLSLTVPRERELFSLVFNSFQETSNPNNPKKRKTTNNENNNSNSENKSPLSRGEVDELFVFWKDRSFSSSIDSNDSFSSESRKALSLLLTTLSESQFQSQSPSPSPSSSELFSRLIECFYDTQFVLGRYRKFSRDVSQSPWSLSSTPVGIGIAMGQQNQQNNQNNNSAKNNTSNNLEQCEWPHLFSLFVHLFF
jgi:hypothetical protein